MGRLRSTDCDRFGAGEAEGVELEDRARTGDANRRAPEAAGGVVAAAAAAAEAEGEGERYLEETGRDLGRRELRPPLPPSLSPCEREDFAGARAEEDEDGGDGNGGLLARLPGLGGSEMAAATAIIRRRERGRELKNLSLCLTLPFAQTEKEREREFYSMQ